MSLDVYLTLPGVQHSAEARIFIREDGQNKEITRAEWDLRYPDREPYTMTSEESDTVYSANITHNLGLMATEAGIYGALWRPEEIGITHAGQLIEPLKAGLALLKSDPERFKAFNPSNGWGSYGGLRQFVADYLVACEEYPAAGRFGVCMECEEEHVLCFCGVCFKYCHDDYMHAEFYDPMDDALLFSSAPPATEPRGKQR